MAVEEITPYLENQGFRIDYFSNNISGEARDFSRSLYQIITRKLNEYENFNQIALIGTGELTVTIRGTGIGGRNQEMLLGFLDFIKEKEFDDNFMIISANLDGIEGNSEAMGALIDNSIISQIQKKHIDTKTYLDNNNSNGIFKMLNTEIVSGPTGCNVNDLLLVLIIKGENKWKTI